ncbi:MAG TPA: hypothetical protein VKZ18_23165 [Polyangia bacterium]|nr:hypothetical protein [Polyangia bacterium]
MATGKKPSSGGSRGDDESVDVEDLFGDLFEDAPPTDPTVPSLNEDTTLEVPAAGSAGAEPEPEREVPTLFAPTLPEMEPEIWQAGIQALVTVPDQVEPAPASREVWLDDARLYGGEANAAETPELAAQYLAAAALAAEIVGEADEAAAGYDEALARAPTAAAILRARARLAESVGDVDEAHALWARLALAAGSREERSFYGALAAEWTLARRGALPAVALEAIPAGPARALAVAEEALRGGTPGAVAGALAAAGRALGGAQGAAFLDQAARFAEAARDGAAAAGHRAGARKLVPTPGPLARLREAARADARSAAGKVAELLAVLPAGSALARAVGRWGASLARRRGDAAGALALLAGQAGTTSALARDRLDLEAATGTDLDPGSLAHLRASASAPAASANLTWIEAVDLIRRGELADAAALLGPALDEHADAVPLALVAEEIAAATDEPGLRATALELWLRGDSGRRAHAALALASTRAAAGSGLAARAALQTAVESAPESASFWAAAADDARAGRRGDAAATLAYGAEVWGASTLAPGLEGAAAAKHAPSDPARVLAALGVIAETPLPGAARALGARATARLAERAADRGALEAALSGALEEVADPAERTWLCLWRASAIPAGEGEARALALEAALESTPAHPLALALHLSEPSVSSEAAAAALARAGAAAGDTPGLARTLALAAASTHALAGDPAGALGAASRLLGTEPAAAAARRAVARAAVRLGPGGAEPRDAGARTLAALAVDPEGLDEALSLTIAEARVSVGFSEAAQQALGVLAEGRFAADARRAGLRLDPASTEGLRPGLLAGPADRPTADARAALAALTAAAAAGDWEALADALVAAPPHEAPASPGTLALAALLAEGHDLPGVAERLREQAVRASGETTPAPEAPLATLGWAADGAADTGLRLQALTQLTSRLGAAESARRSAAAALAERARLEEATGDPAAAGESWRAALGGEPTFLPAARALRVAAARAGDPRAASAAAETEASCLLVPAYRVRALLLAAALAMEVQPPERERALGLLRAALAVDPTHEAAFERLRGLLVDLDDAPALAAALAARIEVAQNPFEVTTLRLARADLLGARLGEWAGARGELEAVLARQPEHARALERLSDLLWGREAWGEAGEIYLRRAVVERDPATLRAIFLRLGEIYSLRVPDPKRAAAAYERVLSVDAENLEALRALSDLTVAEGDSRRALVFTERLVAREPDAARRLRTRVRLGEVLAQTGDLRRAGVELRRAADEAPRDVGAVVALAALLDRARDQAGRRVALDRAVGLLRRDLAGEPRIETLRSLATLLELRERPHAALAAAQLVAALGAGAREGARAAARPGRSLAALRRPEVDETAFSSDVPPGIRQVMKQLGPLLRPSGQEMAQRLAFHGVTRADRRTRGAPPRPLFDSVAAELGVGDFDLYLKDAPAAAGPVPLRAEPGNPPALIVGAALEGLGPAAMRFVAARALRLTATHLDALLAVPPEEAGALLVGIIRQFVPEFSHAEVRESLVGPEAARAERAIPRKLKPQVMPFAVESAGAFDLGALTAAVRDGANAVGLLASADLPAALSVILELAGTIVVAPNREASAPGGTGLSLAAIGANPEAMSLLRFAVSDEHDELARALES